MADVNFIVLLFTAIVMALAFGLMGLFKDWMENAATMNWPKIAATIVYSIIVGIIAVMTGMIDLNTLSNWQAIFSPMWTAYFMIYTGLLYIFGKVFVPVASKFTAKTTLYTTKYAKMGLRKMDAETRKWLVSDLAENLKQPVIACVDVAEGMDPVPFQYAIQGGAWIFLIENGEVTGAKHYYFRGWFGVSVTWKPISAACLEKIRATGKFPEYEDLY